MSFLTQYCQLKRKHIQLKIKSATISTIFSLIWSSWHQHCTPHWCQHSLFFPNVQISLDMLLFFTSCYFRTLTDSCTCHHLLEKESEAMAVVFCFLFFLCTVCKLFNQWVWLLVPPCALARLAKIELCVCVCVSLRRSTCWCSTDVCCSSVARDEEKLPLPAWQLCPFTSDTVLWLMTPNGPACLSLLLHRL